MAQSWGSSLSRSVEAGALSSPQLGRYRGIEGGQGAVAEWGEFLRKWAGRGAGHLGRVSGSRAHACLGPPVP